MTLTLVLKTYLINVWSLEFSAANPGMGGALGVWCCHVRDMCGPHLRWSWIPLRTKANSFFLIAASVQLGGLCSPSLEDNTRGLQEGLNEQ